jgi:hypothetical protein
MGRASWSRLAHSLAFDDSHRGERHPTALPSVVSNESLDAHERPPPRGQCLFH